MPPSTQASLSQTRERSPRFPFTFQKFPRTSQSGRMDMPAEEQEKGILIETALDQKMTSLQNASLSLPSS